MGDAGKAGGVKRDKKKLPGTYMAFVKRFSELGKAHERVAKAALAAGPMDLKMCALVKLGIALGAGLESAVKSHVRRAREAGASEKEIDQAIILGMNTIGFPRTVAAWRSAREQLEREKGE